jgi:hypothetical protein
MTQAATDAELGHTFFEGGDRRAYTPPEYPIDPAIPPPVDLSAYPVWLCSIILAVAIVLRVSL